MAALRSGHPSGFRPWPKKSFSAETNGEQLVVVVSAMSGETDRLLSLAATLSEHPVPRELDVLLATGEQTTIALLSMALEERGCAGALLHRCPGAHSDR